MRSAALVLAFVTIGCAKPLQNAATPDSARHVFLRAVDSLLLDTRVHEFSAVLMVKIRNPNKDDESPLADSTLPHPPAPGPHTQNGALYAEVGVLRDLLGRDMPVEIDTARHHVYVGKNPEVLLIGHPHGASWYVPVKLFARQFGAYVDVGCTLANCATIWPRSIMEEILRSNLIGTGLLEAQAEGIISGINVRRLPGG
jgi:hypothetical protein